MKTKLLLILLVVTNPIYSQYSNYYNVDLNSNSNVNYSGSVDVNINKKVDVSGNVNVNKTLTTIDYGALAQANAAKQRNRIEQMKVQNENERIALLAIAEDPVKAYDYGTDNNWKLTSKLRKQYGWGKEIKTMYHKIPHKSLFVSTGGYTYLNEDENGVNTEMNIYVAQGDEVIGKAFKPFMNNLEDAMNYDDFKEGTEIDWENDGKLDGFLHKKDLNRAKISGVNGFVGTLIFEDKYEKRITDNYMAVGLLGKTNYLLFVKVRYSGDKDEVTFEQLEGRRYYLKRLINKTISTINYY